MSDFVNLFPGWIGFYNEELGAVLAARKDGSELLFACKDGAKPLKWIPTGQFMLHPRIIRDPEEFPTLI